MKFKGEAEPDDLVHSGSTLDTKDFYVVYHNFGDARVDLRLGQITKARYDGNYVNIQIWLWSKGLKEFRTWYWYDLGDPALAGSVAEFQTKFFKYKKHADAYLSYARLKGFAISSELPEKPKKKLRVIKLNN